jgi:hypothetical protein
MTPKPSGRFEVSSSPLPRRPRFRRAAHSSPSSSATTTPTCCGLAGAWLTSSVWRATRAPSAARRSAAARPSRRHRYLLLRAVLQSVVRRAHEDVTARHLQAGDIHELLIKFASDPVPDGALMVRCGNRREACCPSCAHECDMWQLVYTGLAGGRKGVPEQVAEHPQVFASLTAPSFGAVHSRPDDGRRCRCGRRHDGRLPCAGRGDRPGQLRLRGRGAVELARPRAVEPLHHRAGPRRSPRRTGRHQRTGVAYTVRVAYARSPSFKRAASCTSTPSSASMAPRTARPHPA